MTRTAKKVKDFCLWLSKEGEKNWGKRCKKFAMLCATCHFWEIYDHVKILSEHYEEMDSTIPKK